MENTQNETSKLANQKVSEAQKKAITKYRQGKWLPSVYIDKSQRYAIETRIAQLGLKSFNEYIHLLIDHDMGKWD